MRLMAFIVAVVFLVSGILFGALNAGEVVLDFYRFQFTLPLGVALLGFAVLGAAAAGALLWITVIWPQRRRIARLARRDVTPATPPEPTPSAFPGAP